MSKSKAKHVAHIQNPARGGVTITERRPDFVQPDASDDHVAYVVGGETCPLTLDDLISLRNQIDKWLMRRNGASRRTRSDKDTTGGQ